MRTLEGTETQRLRTFEGAKTQRLRTFEGAETQRLRTFEGTETQRLGTFEGAETQRLGTFEGAETQRLRTFEGTETQDWELLKEQKHKDWELLKEQKQRCRLLPLHDPKRPPTPRFTSHYLKSFFLWPLRIRIQIRWIRKILASLDPNSDPQKYADPRIRIQGAKYQQKTEKKKFTLNPQI